MVKGEPMSRCRICICILVVIVFFAATDLSRAENRSKEVLPADFMSGTITTPFESGKILLASNDKIIIEFKTDYGIKPGDYLEIFQTLTLNGQEDENGLYRKIGLGIVIEKIDPTHAVCIIDSSVKEVAVGDLVRVVHSR
jgi:hypothetical protein